MLTTVGRIALRAAVVATVVAGVVVVGLAVAVLAALVAWVAASSLVPYVAAQHHFAYQILPSVLYKLDIATHPVLPPVGVSDN